MKRTGLIAMATLCITTIGTVGWGQGYLRNDGTTSYTSGVTINEVSARSATTDFNADGAVSFVTDKDEYIEIVNNAPSTIDIGGWVLGENNDNFTFPSPTNIDPGKAVVVFTRGATISNFNPGSGNQAFAASGMALANTDDAVGLRNTNNLYIAVHWQPGILNSTLTTGATVVGANVALSSWTEGQSQTRNPDYTGSWAQHPTISGAVNWSNGSPAVSLTDPKGSPGRFAHGDPLPVELSSFAEHLRGDAVEPNWSTATEVNNFGFEADRNAVSLGDGWKKIGLVEGHGTSNTAQRYSFVDRHLTFGKTLLSPETDRSRRQVQIFTES